MKNDDCGWIGPLVSAEVARMNAETKAHFDRTVKAIDDLERETALRRLLGDVFGHRTYEVPEAESLARSGWIPARRER